MIRVAFRRHPLVFGFGLMFLLTWPLELGLAAQSHSLLPFRIPDALGLFAGYGIVAAALISTYVAWGRPAVTDLLMRFLLWRVGLQWYIVALVGFACVAGAALVAARMLNGTWPDFSDVQARRLFGASANLWLLVLPFLLVDVFTNGEEIGWRGYALPQLQLRRSALVSSLVIGAVWTAWHAPRFLTAGNTDSVALFGLDTFAKAILFTWLFNRTGGSLLLTTLFHASINTTAVFLPISASSATAWDQPYVILITFEWIIAVGLVLTHAIDGGAKPPVTGLAEGSPAPDRGARQT